MIKKLRRNIIIINMLFVGIVILLIFAAVCINNYTTSRNNLEHGLVQVLDKKPDYGDGTFVRDRIGDKDNKEQPNGLNINAYVVVEVDASGNIIETYESNVTIEETDLQAAVKIALEQNGESGEIVDYNLIFAKKDIMGKCKIAFADSRIIYSTLGNTIVVCLGLFFGGLAVVFLISLGLSWLAVKPVKKAWLQQKQFVADASHELKTPLTVILANNNIMMSHKNATIDEEKQWLESTEVEATHMKNLIDQMLFLAKSDAEQTKFEQTSLDLSEIIEGTVLNFEPIAYEKSVTINSEIEPQIMVNGDVTMLTQLSHILIDNAVKYAGIGGTVNVALSRANDGCRLSVNNSGEIISEEDLPHLFDRFYRADKARSEGGYGLGLSIAHNIVKQHKGKIEVESRENYGTTFKVTF
jgi:signal transduction histidine kinase